MRKNDRQMRKNDRQMRKNDRDAKFDRENVFKVRPGKSCKIRPGKLYKVWPKSLAENCCKRKQTQSISAMNSQSSINWVQLQNSNLNLLKHAKLQPLVGMPRQSGPRCAPGKQNSNLSVDWDHVVWSIGVLSL